MIIKEEPFRVHVILWHEREQHMTNLCGTICTTSTAAATAEMYFFRENAKYTYAYMSMNIVFHYVRQIQSIQLAEQKTIGSVNINLII
jgi:hypothetical protein